MANLLQPRLAIFGLLIVLASGCKSDPAQPAPKAPETPQSTDTAQVEQPSQPAPEASAAPDVAAAPTEVPADRILEAGLESPLVLASSDGAAFLGISIHPATTERAADDVDPVAFSLVVDCSGSMEGESIENARFAASQIIEALALGDEIALTKFSDQVTEVVKLVKVTDASRAEALKLVAEFMPTGPTALHAGLVTGLAALDGAEAATRRVILVSDGIANVGFATAPEIIANLPVRQHQTTVSTIGVGTAYDEEVLVGVGRYGTGGFYHLTDPVQLAGILEDELARARSVVASDTVVLVQPASGIEILEGLGHELERLPDGTVKLQVGNLYGGESATITLKVKVDTTLTPDPNAKLSLARVQVDYAPRQGDAVTRDAMVQYALVGDQAQVDGAQVPMFMVAADRMRVAHVLTDAADLIKEGDLLEAQAIMRDERTRLERRIERLDGKSEEEVAALIEMFRDPYVDVDLSGAPSTQPQPVATKDEFTVLIDIAREGNPLPEDKLAGIDAARLRILRNASYARHGYTFRADDLQAWFGATSWYKTNPDFDRKMLTRTDVKNVALVKSYERRSTLVSSTAAPPKPRGPAPDFDALMARIATGGTLQGADVSGLDLAQLRILRNASYARHGYAFRSSDLREHFAKLDWYKPNPAFNRDQLDRTDHDNIKVIKAQESGIMGAASQEAVRDFQLRNRANAYDAATR